MLPYFWSGMTWIKTPNITILKKIEASLILLLALGWLCQKSYSKLFLSFINHRRLKLQSDWFGPKIFKPLQIIFTSRSKNFLPKSYFFYFSGQKSSLGHVKKILGSKPGQPLIFYWSEVCLYRVGPSLVMGLG